MRREYKEIGYEEAVNFLLPRHYSGRIPSISVSYGEYSEEGKLEAVLTIGKPASPSLCRGIMGEAWSSKVYELNRLCRVEEYGGILSKFVSWCLREVSKRDWVIVSYSDSAMNHHGYIYQACNFIYTGMTKERTDKWTAEGKHSRHYKAEEQSGYRKVRSAKHRYVYYATRDKKLKREWRRCMRYKEEEYPKGDNSRYVLGEYLKDRVIKAKGGEQE